MDHNDQDVSSHGSTASSPSSESAAAEVEEGDGPSSTTTTNVDENCVRLTEEQYSCIAKLAQDCRLQGPYAAKTSFPTWKELMKGRRHEFSWLARSGWLGGLKFGLISEAVEGGGILYDQIFSVYERLVATHDCHLSLVKLDFRHIGGGWFRIQVGKKKQLTYRPQRQPTKEALGRAFRKLSSEALHMRRTQKPQVSAAGYRRGGRSSEAVQHLPGGEADSDDEVEMLDSHLSVGFCDELKRTVAYIGTQLEERGERVNWRKLDGDLKDKGQGSVLHTMGVLLDSHIRNHGHLLVTGKLPEDDVSSDSDSFTE